MNPLNKFHKCTSPCFNFGFYWLIRIAITARVCTFSLCWQVLCHFTSNKTTRCKIIQYVCVSVLASRHPLFVSLAESRIEALSCPSFRPLAGERSLFPLRVHQFFLLSTMQQIMGELYNNLAGLCPQLKFWKYNMSYLGPIFLWTGFSELLSRDLSSIGFKI